MDLGYKVVAINVSDISAMGGLPRYAFLSIALPKALDRAWVYEVMDGIDKACKEWDCSLLGGDSVGSKRDVFLSLNMIGEASLAKIKYRHQAKAGDVICVTGYLGDAKGGLQALREDLSSTPDIVHLVRAHFRPEIHLAQGRWLAAQAAVHAMIDLSDGLDVDLKRLTKSSKKGGVIEISKLPVSDALRQVSLDNSWDVTHLAATGGEDYCLLFTVSSEAFDEVQRAYKKQFGMPLHDVGWITDQMGLTYQKNGESIKVRGANFNHF